MRINIFGQFSKFLIKIGPEKSFLLYYSYCFILCQLLMDHFFNVVDHLNNIGPKRKFHMIREGVKSGCFNEKGSGFWWGVQAPLLLATQFPSLW